MIKQLQDSRAVLLGAVGIFALGLTTSGYALGDGLRRSKMAEHRSVTVRGVSERDVTANLGRARQMYAYAASYFGDPDAQYHLARLMLDSNSSFKDPRQAARWLHSAANKGQYQAQAVLGRMLFKGETGVPRQPARGLMWLTLARSNAGPSETWIADLYESAVKQATDEDRALAGDFLMRWMNGKRD